jgi:hypothetical protein
VAGSKTLNVIRALPAHESARVELGDFVRHCRDEVVIEGGVVILDGAFPLARV